MELDIHSLLSNRFGVIFCKVEWITGDLEDCLSVLDGICNSAYLDAHVQIRNREKEHFNRKKECIRFSVFQLIPAKWL